MSIQVAIGGCLCGQVRFRLAGELIWAGYCHCSSCRRFTGSVVTNWVGVRDTDVVFTSGQPAQFTQAGVDRGFCRDCGSSLTYRADRFPDYLQVHIGALDDCEAVQPMAHVHYAEKPGWFEVADQLPRYPASAAADGNDWQS